MKQSFTSIGKLIACLLLSAGTAGLRAQTTTITGPAGSGQFGRSVTVLTNGNYVVTDPSWDNGATSDVGAVYLYDGTSHALISTLTGSTAGDQVGSHGVTALTNGNFVVSSMWWDNGPVADAGAVTWGSGVAGVTGTVSSSNSLVGSTLYDNVGNTISVLTNGNYVVRTSGWDNGSAADAGAVTWGSGTTGVTGAVSSSNSLVGSTTNDYVGDPGVTVLNNGNYVVASKSWHNGAVTEIGAATWGSGTTGVAGVISSSNSLIGATSGTNIAAEGIIALTNGNYVVNSPYWESGSNVEVGAVTWGNGSTGIVGTVSSSNSLVGSSDFDYVGRTGVIALTNGNYVVGSYNWDNGATVEAGAATWGNGTTGVSGAVSSSNSLVGTSAYDYVTSTGIVALTNGNYVVRSQAWDNGSTPDAGAATWGNGTTGTTGAVSSSNSLYGGTISDNVGYTKVIALTNGNYVVLSQYWDDGATPDAGAATWGDGTTGTSGAVTSSNSLVGSTASDEWGTNAVALSNGNYLVSGNSWDNGALQDAGAVAWGNGTTGTSGAVSSSNALVGSSNYDNVGTSLVALSNGNYVVSTIPWDNGSTADVGAVTWGNGTTGTTGAVSSSNSLVGSTSYDNVGDPGVTALTNGNYVVRSQYWAAGATSYAGAITWGNGTTGIAGTISSSNSLVGNNMFDMVGNNTIDILANGSYTVSSTNWEGITSSSGALSIGNGATPVKGAVSACNSILGGTSGSIYSSSIAFNNTKEYVLAGLYDENKVVVFVPATQDLATATTTSTQVMSGYGKAPFIDASCQLINSLQQWGASPITGSVSNKVYVESTAPVDGSTAYTRRHYDINPATNPATATATLTLYFTQADFDDYNTNNGSDPNLPVNPADAAGITNLKISQQHGTSATGAPGTYSGTTQTIDPVDANIVWNGAESRWEVTFNVTGFSGFFAFGSAIALPVQLLSFDAKLLNNADVLLNWKVADQSKDDSYTVERSSDGSKFTTVGTLQANNTPNYILHDLQPVSGRSYYRLKITSAGGKAIYSAVRSILISGTEGGYTNVYPSPAKDYFMVETNVAGTTGSLCDMQGRALMNVAVKSGEKIDISSLAPGVYLLKLSSGTSFKITKE